MQKPSVFCEAVVISAWAKPTGENQNETQDTPKEREKEKMAKEKDIRENAGHVAKRATLNGIVQKREKARDRHSPFGHNAITAGNGDIKHRIAQQEKGIKRIPYRIMT